MNVAPLSTFTPSVVAPETLETLFVGRTPILEDLVDRARRAGTSDTRSHRMLVGPRGAGKTHLISLAFHRIGALVGVQRSWLPEDPWDIDDYPSFLASILQHRTLRTDELEARTSPVAGVDRDAAALEYQIAHLASSHGPIVVLAENFDLILIALEETGQRSLRSFMENTGALLLLVSATRLEQAITKQTAPFYGNFSTVELGPFSIDDAAAMLARIARYRGQVALAAQLDEPSPQTRQRLAAIDALAGGQPRVWALLGSALNTDGIAELTSSLLTRFDDLTPYYQSQLNSLSPLERKVVRALADADRASTTKGLASRIGATEKTTAKTVARLRQLGWVSEVTNDFAHLLDGRLKFYELSEPLARVAFQIKDSRGAPLPMIVAFLSTWFSQAELSEVTVQRTSSFAMLHIRESMADATLVHELVTVLGGSPTPSSIPDPLLRAGDDAIASLVSGDAKPLFELPGLLRRILEQRISEAGIPQTWVSIHRAGSGLGDWHSRTSRLVEAISEPSAKTAALLLLAEQAANAGQVDSALATLRVLLQTLLMSVGPDHRDTLTTRSNLASLKAEAGDVAGGLAEFARLLVDKTRILGSDHPSTLTTRNNIASLTAQAGDVAGGLAEFGRLLVDQTRILGSDHPSTLTTRNNVALWTAAMGDVAGGLAEFGRLLVDQTRILGSDHPDTLTTRNNIASLTADAGDVAGGLAEFERLLVDRARVLGFDHPDTLRTRNNIDYLIAKSGSPAPD